MICALPMSRLARHASLPWLNVSRMVRCLAQRTSLLTVLLSTVPWLLRSLKCAMTCQVSMLMILNRTDLFQTSSSSETTAATTTGESVAVTTDSGVVKTVTIPAATKATSTSAADNLSSAKSSDNSGMSSGTIAGVVVGSVGGALAILALIFVLFFAKRKSRSNSPDPSVQSILLDGRQSKGSQMSFMKGMFSDNHSHTLSAGSAASRLPTFTDNRMKTDTVLYANGRRDSDVSLQDNEDYSRPVLRVSPHVFPIVMSDIGTLTRDAAHEPRLTVGCRITLSLRVLHLHLLCISICVFRRKQRCYDTHLSHNP